MKISILNLFLIPVLVIINQTNVKAIPNPSIEKLDKIESKNMIVLPAKQKSNLSIMFVARRPTKTILGDMPVSTTDVGHTFVAILEHSNGKISKYTTYGKYPAGLLINIKDDYSDMTKIANNQDLVRLHFEELSLEDYQLDIIKKINSQEGYYDLFTSNCAHYMQRVMNVFYWYYIHT